jgi:RNA polymerase sigma-70 factor (ECF subfamily)
MPSTETRTDAELLRLMMAGDEEAFTELFRRRRRSVYQFAFQMSGCRAVADDITQEVFIILMTEAYKYDPERGSLTAFLYGVARNHVLRRLSQDRAYVPIDQETEESEAANQRFVDSTDPLAELARVEVIEAVRQAILALPAHYREVVVLCELHEMSYADAAGILGCAVGTVRSRLHRARNLLVQKLRTPSAAGVAAASRERCFA